MKSNENRLSGPGQEGVNPALRNIAFLLAAVAAPVAFGQQVAEEAPAANALQEIVVTAQKRSESLQNVPVSIAALDSAELDRRGITSVASLMSGDVPSVKVEPFAGNQTVLEVGMRGFLNPNGTDITQENPVPTYIDDVYYGRQNSLALELNDLERLEVLRGPQGTLFGKNAEGGALRLVSKEPTGEFGVDVKAEGGNYGYWKGVAHVNLPAVGIMSSKIDLLATDSNGWTTNPALGQRQGGTTDHNYGVTEDVAGKVTLLFRFSDTLKAEYAGDLSQLKSTEYWNAQVSYSPTGAPYSAAWPNQLRTPLTEPYDTYRPLDPQKYWGNRVNVEWAPSDTITIKSISAMRVDQSTAFNTAQTSAVIPGPFLLPAGACPAAGVLCTSAITGAVPIYQIDHRQYSQEFQFIGKTDHWDWVGGLFYIHESGSEIEPTYFGTLLPNSIPAAYPYLPVHPTGSALLDPPLGPLTTAGADVTESSKAAFGQATYRPGILDDKLSFTAGLRIGRDDKSALRPAIGGDVYLAPAYPAFPQGPLPAGLPCPQSPQCAPSKANTTVSPLAAIAYAWTPEIQSYLRYSTGYQGAALAVGSQTFKYTADSKVESFELGVKSELLAHTLRMNVAAFYENWKDPQEEIQTVSSSAEEAFNGPTIHISGLEFDSAYSPIAGLTFDGSVTYLHGRQGHVDDPFPPPAGFPPVSAVFQLPALPAWAASIGVSDDIVRTDYGVLRVNVQTNGTASYYSVPNTTTPVSSYWLTDGKLSMADISVGDGGKMELSMWAKNIFNRSYYAFAYQIPGPNTDAAYGAPRMWGGSVEYKFK